MGLLILGIIIFFIVVIHEAGHLIVAKLNGVRVKTFSVGFGKRLIGFKVWKNKITGRRKVSFRILNNKPSIPEIWEMENITEYRIAPIPFGGFCEMVGEIKSTGKPYELASKRFMQKVQIAVAGAFLNCVTGFMAIASIGIKYNGFTQGLIKTFNGIMISIVLTAQNFVLLFSGKANILSPGEVSHQMSNLTLEQSLVTFGVLSIVMGLFNLLPFPALDGSLPFICALHKIFGQKLGQKIAELVWGLGFIVLMIFQAVLFIWWISTSFV